MKLSLKRKQIGLSQKNLAEKLFVSQRAISFWESGLREPDCNTICKLAKLLNCSIEEVVLSIIETKEGKIETA